MEKAQILQEIKRTAAANDGVPLGLRRFESETGIGRSEWFGKYWARWGDAVREAGLTPNRLRSKLYGESQLLHMYAQLSRELGRLPAQGDLQVKRRNDSTFPSLNVFRRRWPNTSELVVKLLEYCRSEGGWDDVVRLCEEYIPRARSGPRESQVSDQEDGFVYLIKSGRFYKIGRTNAAGRRKYELGIELPERAEEIHVIRTDDPSGIGAYWHKRFDAKRKKGEWFELDAADVKAFNRQKFM